MRSIIAGFILGALSACAPASLVPVSSGMPTDNAAPGQVPGVRASLALQARARSFRAVVEAMEPVIESECNRLNPNAECDFQLVIDDRPGQPANAFQTRDSRGRPVIGFTPALIVMTRNADELAFVMAHEAAHHIRNHLERQARDAQRGGAMLAGLARLVGGPDRAVHSAQELGAAVGARSYSRDYELEADRLGALIAQRAGYDALRGARFFLQVPDPGDAFLGTHPPNADRLQAVRAALAEKDGT